MSPAAAFFDFDRTVVDGDAGLLFAKELLRLARRRIRDEEPGTVAWAGRVLQFEARTLGLLGFGGLLKLGSKVGLVKRSETLRRVYRFLRGLAVDDLRVLAQDFFDEVLVDRVFVEAREEMKRHREEGRRVVVVSTGMHLLIDEAKRHLPVDDVIAVSLLAHKGVLTGKVQGPLWGRDKAREVRKYAHERNLSLPLSYAYTDHHSDLHLLRLVGNPVVVNPNLALAWEAKRRRWNRADWKTLPGPRR